VGVPGWPPVVRIESVEALPAGSDCYVRITTDSGLSGVGEGTFFAWPSATAEIVRAFAPALIGGDPFDVEAHWLALYRAFCMRGMAVTSALSAVDQALWDIRGKYFEVPVWQLLGGRVRRAVRAMRVIDAGAPEDLAEASLTAVRDGFSALKILVFRPGDHGLGQARRIENMVAGFAAVREAVGWDVDVAVELHRNLSPGDAVLFCDEIARLRPLFVEDPIPPDSVMRFAEVAARTRVPLAAGERNTTIWEFAEYSAASGLAYVRPDIGVAGGITHVRKICAIAEAHHQGVCPHAVPSGPVAVAACVQLAMATPNWEVQEHVPQDGPRWTDLVDEVVPLREGYLWPPDRPGLGIDLRDAGLARHPPRAADLTDVPRRADGSVAIR